MPEVVTVNSKIGRVGPERQARVMLSFLAEPGEPALGALLRVCTPAEIVAAVSSEREPGAVLPGPCVRPVARSPRPAPVPGETGRLAA